MLVCCCAATARRLRTGVAAVPAVGAVAVGEWPGRASVCHRAARRPGHASLRARLWRTMRCLAAITSQSVVSMSVLAEPPAKAHQSPALVGQRPEAPPGVRCNTSLRTAADLMHATLKVAHSCKKQSLDGSAAGWGAC